MGWPLKFQIPIPNIFGIADCPRQLLHERAHRLREPKCSIFEITSFRAVFHLGFGSLFVIWVFGIWDLFRRQCPWPKIIHQDQATAILSSAVALHPAEVCERAKLESVAQRHEEIVLVTRQNVTRLQTFQRRGQSIARSTFWLGGNCTSVPPESM